MNQSPPPPLPRLLTILSFLLLGFSGYAQIKVNSYGKVGIKTMNPNYSLDIEGNKMSISSKTGSQFSLETVHLDPRICTDKTDIVFFNDWSVSNPKFVVFLIAFRCELGY